MVVVDLNSTNFLCCLFSWWSVCDCLSSAESIVFGTACLGLVLHTLLALGDVLTDECPPASLCWIDGPAEFLLSTMNILSAYEGALNFLLM